MDLGIDGRVAVVAGGSRGCGLAISQALAAEGASVLLSGRQAAHVEEAVESIKSSGGRAAGTVAEMASEDGPRQIVEAAQASFGDPTILVVNPPSASQKRKFDDLDDMDFEKANEIWVLSLVRLSRLVLPAMKKQNWGRILYMGSNGMKFLHLDDPMYAQNVRVAAAAVVKTLAHEYGKFGITANTIATGPFMTSLASDYMGSGGLPKDGMHARNASGRWGRPEEMGSVAAFLCSAAASFVTGETIRVDSGSTHNLF